MTRTNLFKCSLSFFVAAILITTTGVSQSDYCQKFHDIALEEYKAKRYHEALTDFRRTDRCELTKNQYYNGAFIAALTGDKKLAFYYLRKAVDLGYSNLDHMSTDPDLNSIRSDPEYARIVQSIETMHDGIIKYFNGVAPIDNLIPYYKNDKWGWLEKATLKAKTDAVFDYADFPTSAGLDFGYRGKNYRYTVEKEVIEPPDFPDFQVEIMNSGPTPVHGMRGFEFDQDELLTNYSDKYVQVEIVKRFSQVEYLVAIATDSTGAKGVINQAGDTLKGFGFRYAEIHPIRDSSGGLIFVAKRMGQDYFLFYRKNGEVAYTYRFTNHRNLDKYENVRGNYSSYAGPATERDEAIQENGKWYILTRTNGKKITDKGYDDVRVLNGPATERDSYGDLRRGNLPVYYLVKEGRDLFYIGRDGKEYRIK